MGDEYKLLSAELDPFRKRMLEDFSDFLTQRSGSSDKDSLPQEDKETLLKLVRFFLSDQELENLSKEFPFALSDQKSGPLYLLETDLKSK